MNNDTFNLPQRINLQSEVLDQNRNINDNDDRFSLIENQMDKLVDAAAKSVPEIINIFKDMIAIIKIREQNIADVEKIEAETNKHIESIRAEIQKMEQERKNIETKGDIVIHTLEKFTALIKIIPEQRAEPGAACSVPVGRGA